MIQTPAAINRRQRYARSSDRWEGFFKQHKNHNDGLQRTFITPMTKRSAINIQQQPTQKMPWRMPSASEPRTSALNTVAEGEQRSV